MRSSIPFIVGGELVSRLFSALVIGFHAHSPLDGSDRPLILPIYLSVPASNLVSMRSYSHFCFMQYIRFNAFRKSDDGSISNGIAEQCYRFSQNLPTVILLLPRAAMCLALLLAFSSPGSAGVASGNAGSKPRDATYFNGDGALTSYGRGILIFNAVWIAWRVLVLLASWYVLHASCPPSGLLIFQFRIGLWILSGQGCAGFCGPRYRWEELDDSDEKAEENPSAYYLQRNESVVETWPWLPFTAARIQDAFDLCLISRPKRATSEKTVAELESERRHSKAPSLPHELPPMKQISGEFAVIPSRKPSDAEPSGLRTIPASPQTPATPAGGARAPLLQAPEAAAVVPMLGAPSASAARRSILDDGVFSRYGAARTSSKPSTPPDGTEKANGSRPPSLWAGATVENDLPKGKGKERASLHSQRPRPQEEEDAPLPSSSLVPPYPYLGETAGAVAPLPFPLRPADDQAQGDDLTPPQGSDASAEHVVDEDEDDTAGLDLEGFVVGEDDDDDVDEEDTEQQQQHQQQQPVQSPRGPRVSDENGGSGSISSLGQPIAPSFPLLAGDSIPRRSQSVGSTGSPLSHRFPSGVDEEGRWSFSPPHSSAAGSAGVRSRAGSQPGVAGASLDPPPRHPSAGSSVHRRRTRADTVPSPLASSQSSDERSRLRTISMQDQTFGVQIPLPPVQGTDDDDILDVDDYDADLQVITEERKEGTVEDEGRGASLDEGEREDSVGLLSQGPSPKSSIGVLRSRANSLVSGTRRRPGSQSSQNSGSAAFVSAPSATLSHSQSASFIAGRRSRQLSAVSASTTGPHLFPAQQTRSGSDSPGSNTSRPDRTSRMMDEEDHTFGFQRPVNWDSVPRLSSAGPSRHVSLVSGPPPLPMPSPEARRSLRPSSSRSTTGASEVTSSQVPLATEVSEAPSTYVTAAPTIESTSEGATVRSYRPLDDFTRDVM